MTSIRRQLLGWLVAGLSIATVAGAWAVFARARAEARDLFDYQMKLMVDAFPDEGFGGSRVRNPTPGVPSDVVVVQIWDRNGTRIYLSRPGWSAPQRAEIGFSNVRARDGEWRVYTALVGDNVVQVAQPVSVREELAAGIAVRTMLPLAVLLPLLIVFAWITIGRGLKPINDVAEAMTRRSAGALDPVAEAGLPAEVRPLVASVDALLLRLGQSLERERAFIADAAHELRTPLTALHLQIQLAQRAASEEERSAALERLKGGTERATRLVEQLLALARSEPDAADRMRVPVNLTTLARDVVAEQAPIASSRSLDLGFSGDENVTVEADPDALRIMLGNLVDNALRYTPPGGRIDVTARLDDRFAELAVADDGQGIPVEERERVFDRFYRGREAGGTGSGLGLAIVREIAERHGTRVEVSDGLSGRGVTIRLRFPAATAHP
jgi:two-component system OmpR family sensor kinase